MATRAQLLQGARTAADSGNMELAQELARRAQAMPAEEAPAQQQPSGPPVGTGTVLAPEPEPVDNRPSWERDPEGFARRVEEEKAAIAKQYDPTKGQTFGRNALQGAGRSADKLQRGVRQLWNYATGDDEEARQLEQEEAQSRELDKPLMHTGGGNVGYYGTEAAMTLLPATKLAKANAVVKGGRAALALGEAGLGAAQGFVQPTTADESHLTNAGIGGAFGFAMPYIPGVAAAANRGLARIPLFGKPSLMMLEMADRQAGRAAKKVAQEASFANQAAGREAKAAVLRQKAEEKAANLAAKELATATRQRANAVIENQVGRNSGMMTVTDDFAKRLQSLSRHYGDQLPESFHRGVAQINVPGTTARVPYQAVQQMKSDLGTAARAASANRQANSSVLHRAEREVMEGMLATMPQRKANLLRTAYRESASGTSQAARRGVRRPVTPGPVQVPVQAPARGQQLLDNVLDYTKGMPAAFKRQLARRLGYEVYPKDDEEGE